MLNIKKNKVTNVSINMAINIKYNVKFQKNKRKIIKIIKRIECSNENARKSSKQKQLLRRANKLNSKMYSCCNDNNIAK